MAQIIPVSDLSAPELAVFSRLTEAQLRSRLDPAASLFLAESPKVIRTVLESGCEPVSFLMEEKHITGDAAPILDMLPDIPVYTAERSVLASLTGYTLTRGVLCAFRRPVQPDMRTLCTGVRRLAVLEAITDSTNVGAIFRSAAALNVDAVLLSPACCDPLNRRSVRVSMGAVLQVPWGRFEGSEADWLNSGPEMLRSLGFHTAAMALRPDAVTIEDPSLRQRERLAILLGTEGTGLDARTVDACDDVVRIPMAHGVDSLNVAAAAAVAFWALRL